MKSDEFKHVFGPVPSRRLGRSLGVDLVPFKTCTYDCVYCQLGPTTNRTVKRAEYVPTADVLAELRRKIEAGIRADYITLSGSGEPTLHNGCGEIIRTVKTLTDIPVAVLTNGSLLWDPAVRQDLLAADLIVPSLDAGDEAAFAEVNHPHPDIDFNRMLRGLIDFRREFSGQYWLEVFILSGHTDDEQAAKMAALAHEIQPDRIQLNTVARPPAYKSAAPMPEPEMHRLAGIFGDRAEVVADFRKTHDQPEFAGQAEDVLALLERRPCTLDDVAASLDLHRNEALKHLDHLLKQGAIETERVGEKTFYVRRER